MRIKGNITGVPYQALLGNVLPSIDFRNLDINSAPPTFWLNYGLMNGFAVSKWVSPKRTRSYPYERVYNTLSANKKITIIPIIKDEGSAGETIYTVRSLPEPVRNALHSVLPGARFDEPAAAGY